MLLYWVVRRATGSAWLICSQEHIHNAWRRLLHLGSSVQCSFTSVCYQVQPSDAARVGAFRQGRVVGRVLNENIELLLLFW
jgi:hypothetical protein